MHLAAGNVNSISARHDLVADWLAEDVRDPARWRYRTCAGLELSS